MMAAREAFSRFSKADIFTADAFEKDRSIRPAPITEEAGVDAVGDGEEPGGRGGLSRAFVRRRSIRTPSTPVDPDRAVRPRVARRLSSTLSGQTPNRCRNARAVSRCTTVRVAAIVAARSAAPPIDLIRLDSPTVGAGGAGRIVDLGPQRLERPLAESLADDRGQDRERLVQQLHRAPSLPAHRVQLHAQIGMRRPRSGHNSDDVGSMP